MEYKGCLQVLIVVTVSLSLLYVVQTFAKGKSLSLGNILPVRKKEEFTPKCLSCEGECTCNMNVHTPIQTNVVPSSQEVPMETSCFPKQQLQPSDLIPSRDENCEWNKSVQNLGDMNFLEASRITGIDTVSSSLRNANMQLRSEPANPQMKVSPWMNTTINPDLERKPLEGCE